MWPSSVSDPRQQALSGADKLPHELLLRVFANCNGDDVRVLSEVSRRFCAAARDNHLWRVLYTRRTGHPPHSDTRPFRQQYDEQDRLALGIVRDCEIVHNRAPYWSALEDQRGMFGQLALLSAVSWLHVSGQLRGVHTGTYRVVWRLAVFPRAANVFSIDFSAETSAGRVSESRLPFNASLHQYGSDLFDFALPRPLVITAPFEDVILACKETSTEWKTNIALCSVRLEPVSKLPCAERYRANSRHMALGTGRAATARPPLLPPPGAGYRLWKPWTPVDRYGTACMVLFVTAIAVGFAYLLVDGAM